MRPPRPLLLAKTMMLALLLASLFGGTHLLAQVPDPGSLRVAVSREFLIHDDGDSFAIRWPEREEESVRILGIDAPEVQHLDHDIPYAQPFGEAAAAFIQGCCATAEKLELLRSGQQDPFGRTLAYLYIDGRNYSVLVLQARLAVESVSRYGDNGLPDQARECLEAARSAGPVPFEDPHAYRARMRQVARWLKDRGRYPGGVDKR